MSSRLAKLLTADAGLTADDRRTFAGERALYNVRVVRWVFPFAAASHLAIVGSLAGGAVAPAMAWYYRVVLILQAALLVTTTAVLIAAWQRRGPLARLHPYMGELATVPYVVCGALLSANSQRLPAMPLQMFLLVSLGGALFRPRAAVHVGAILVGALVVSAAVLGFQVDAAWRATNLITALTCSCVGVGAFLLLERYRGLELGARTALARLNGELERRVAEQVGEIVTRAKQIEELNGQLAEKVKERSRELSVALARLADASSQHEHVEEGTVLADRVVIEARIGAGGMGTVYRGFDRVTKGPVAVKIVQAASVQELDCLQRFLREATAMASVQHLAVVRSLLVDVSEDGRLFQVMELVEGETLATQLGRGPLVAPVAARLGAVLASALAAAHAAAVIHCDVKPANIMVTKATPGLRLLDFGISLLRDARVAAGATSGRVLGTPAFMAPEQFAGRDGITDRADVYSLGLVVFECLTHRLPYTATTPRDWFVAHVSQRPRQLGDVVPGVDDELAQLVMSCLDKEPAERPAAGDVAARLGAIADRLGAPNLEDVPWERAVRAVGESVRVEAAVTLRD